MSSLQKTRVGSAATSDLNTSAGAASDALEKLTAAAERLTAQLSQVTGGSGAGGASGGSPAGAASAQAAGAFFSASAQASSPASGNGAGPAFGANPNWGTATAQMFWMQQQQVLQASSNPGGTLLRDAQGRFVSPAALMNGGGGGLPPQGGAQVAAASPAPDPLNPFADADAIGPSSKIGTPGLQLNTYLMQQQAQQTQLRMATSAAVNTAAAGALLQGTTGTLHAYTQSVVSGQQNAMGFGQAYGSAGGAIVGTLIASAGMGLGPLGIAAGALIGGQIGGAGTNALQARFQATYQAAQTVGTYAAATGQDAMIMATGASESAKAVNNARMSELNTRGNFHDFIEGNLRAWGLYQGADQTSTQQMGQTQAALGGGYLQNGMALGPWAIDSMSRGFADRYGVNAPAVAQQYATAIGGLNRSGNNMTDLALRVGITPTVTMLRHRGEDAEADALVGGYGVYQAAQYRTEGSASRVRGLSADYDASQYSGQSTRQRRSGFDSLMAGMKSEVSAIDGELGALSSMPGGANSNEAKAKRALRQELLRDIARESSQRASGVLSDSMGEGSVRFSAANVASTRAGLYGGPNDFAPAAQGLVNALGGEAQGIQDAMRDPHLSYADRLQGQRRLNEIASARIAIPAQAAVQRASRTALYADVRQSGLSYDSQAATMYGSDEAVGQAARGSVSGREQTIGELSGLLKDPNLPVEQRAQVMMQINREKAGILSDTASARDVQIGRMSARANIAQTTASVGLQKAQYGSASDVRSAVSDSVKALESEQAQIQSQLKQGGLTVDQELRLKQRAAQLPGDIFTTQQAGIDAANRKQDITGYDLQATRLSGALQRAQYMPYSPTNMYRLSLQQIRLNEGQIGVLNQREAELKRGGNLSPERQLEIEQQRQMLLTQNAAAEGQLSEGVLSRMPAMLAGGNRYSGRFTTPMLAAMALGGSGNNSVRAFGAANGRHLRAQDDFYADVQGNTPTSASSRTAGLNRGQETNDLLRQILQALTQGRGRSGGRADESLNAVSDLMRRAGGSNNNGFRPSFN